MVNHWRTFIVATLSVVAVVSVSLLAQDPPPRPHVESITYGGSGCPQGSVGASFSNDRRTFTLIFDKFVASSGPNIQPTEHLKDCQINVNVNVPPGTGRFCTTFDYRGYAQVPGNVTAGALNEYQFEGNASPYELPDGQVITVGDEHEPMIIDGPAARDYLVRDQDDWYFSNAEATTMPLAIYRQIAVAGNTNLAAQLTTDSIDGKVAPCDGDDTTPPTITISSPVSGGLYGLGAHLTPVFSCDDGDGSGVASCEAPSQLDTTSIGAKSFTVTATDNAGNTSTATVNYSVGGKNECKNSGYGKFLAPMFRNQGQCVSHYAIYSVQR